MELKILYGLLLAGGKSSRMGQDKAFMSYHGQNQTSFGYNLLKEICSKVFVSVREDQKDNPHFAGYPLIFDSEKFKELGPIGGILSALDTHTNVGWLVLACDLPFVNQKVLKHLIEQRDPTKLATAYKSSYDELPEPLCAIYEPAARDFKIGILKI